MFDVDASLLACSRQYMPKTAEDHERYTIAIDTTRPEVIVETGTHVGASARWFAEFGLDVITVDVNASPVGWSSDERVTPVIGNSVADETLDVVVELINDRRTMVSLDSDHSTAHVTEEIERYGALVTPGCYLVVEDGIVRWMNGQPYAGSPLDAIEMLLVDNPQWQYDEALDHLHPVTLFPKGWWVKCA